MAQATVSIRLGKDYTNIKLAVSTNANLSNPLYSNSHSSANKTVKITIDGLLDNTLYYYGVVINNTLQTKGRGQFKTFIPKGAGNFTCAFASCAFTGSEHEVFTVIRNHNPNIFIHMGDLHYSDIITNNRDLYRTAYDNVFASVKQSTLYSQIPTAYVWDDHDYGNNNSNKGNPGKEAAALTYRERVPHYELPTGSSGNPIYQSFVIGRVRFIMTDLRFMKESLTATDNESKTMMGEAQIQWFFNELLKTEPLKIWVNSKPWIGVAKTGEDYWASYSYERNRIANFIKKNNLAGRVAIISGDMHGLAIDDGTNSDYATGGGAPIPVFQAAQLDQNPSAKGGPWTSGAAFTSVDSGQFGIMNINDDGTNPISVEWIGKRLDVTLTSHTFTAPSSEYVPPIEIPEDVTNLQSSEVTETSLLLSWTASTSESVWKYEIYKNNVLLDETMESNYRVLGLTAGTAYTFTIKTVAVHGTVSQGSSIQISTLSGEVIEDIPTNALMFRVDASNVNSIEFGSDNLITQVNDISGNNGGFLTTTSEASTSRPTYMPNDSNFNNKPTIKLVDNRRLRANPITANFVSNNLSLVFIGSLNDYTTSNSQRLWTLQKGSADLIGIHKSANGQMGHRHGTTTGDTELFSSELPKLDVFITVLTPTSSKTYRNGVLTFSNDIALTPSGSLIFLIGYTTTSTVITNMTFSEAAIYDREITSLEIERITNYMKLKWGIV